MYEVEWTREPNWELMRKSLGKAISNAISRGEIVLTKDKLNQERKIK